MNYVLEELRSQWQSAQLTALYTLKANVNSSASITNLFRKEIFPAKISLRNRFVNKCGRVNVCLQCVFQMCYV